MSLHPRTMSHLDKAYALIAKGDYDSLLYAALELRQSIECLVYDALPSYQKSGEIADSAAGDWKPYDILNALVDCNPELPHTVKLRFAPEDSQGKPGRWIDLGSQRGLNPKHLRGLWQRLSSFLHAHKSNARHDEGKLRNSLGKAVDYLEPYRKDDFLLNLADSTRLRCGCGREIVRRLSALRRNPIVRCPAKTCGAEYEWDETKEDIEAFRLLEIEFICRACEAKCYLGRHLIKDGVVIKCPHCSKKWKVAFGFVTLPEPDNQSL